MCLSTIVQKATYYGRETGGDRNSIQQKANGDGEAYLRRVHSHTSSDRVMPCCLFSCPAAYAKVSQDHSHVYHPHQWLVDF